MGFEQQVADFPSGKSFAEQITEREEISERLAHLFAFDQQMGRVEPIFDEALAGRLHGRAFALRDLILMMWKGQVLTAEMQIETWPKNLHAHGTALDVPAG